MHLIGEQPRYADELVGYMQALTAQLLDTLPLHEAPLGVAAGEDFSARLQGDEVFLIISGQVRMRVDNRPAFSLGAGDLLGLYQQPEMPPLSYRCEEDLLLQPFSRQAFCEHVYASPELIPLYERLLISQIVLLSDGLSSRYHAEIDSASGYRQFAAGEELICQGDDAEEVYVIVEGYAEAYVDGHRVGDVCKDEIFGAMAVFTGEKRSASVIASEPCTVMAIPKEQFISLMHQNPKIAHSLIESLARRITLLNQEVLSLRPA